MFLRNFKKFVHSQYVFLRPKYETVCHCCYFLGGGAIFIWFDSLNGKFIKETFSRFTFFSNNTPFSRKTYFFDLLSEGYVEKKILKSLEFAPQICHSLLTVLS